MRFMGGSKYDLGAIGVGWRREACSRHRDAELAMRCWAQKRSTAATSSSFARTNDGRRRALKIWRESSKTARCHRAEMLFLPRVQQGRTKFPNNHRCEHFAPNADAFSKQL